MAACVRRFALVVAGIIAVACLGWLPAQPVRAATLTVYSTADSGGTCPGDSCTLRQAIATAASGDTINFDLALITHTITLTTGTLTIAKNLTISGLGADNLTVDGNSNGSVFTVTSGTVTISGLTIQHGSGTTAGVFTQGGGINHTGGTLTVMNCTLANNASGGGNGIGGGIYNSGTLTVTNSTFSGNSAPSGGSGGGIETEGGGVTVTNSTFTSNSATGGINAGGGGISADGGTLTVTNSTFSGNTAQSGLGGGILNQSGNPATLTNTIVANSTGGDLAIVGVSTFTGNNNLIDDAASAGGFTDNDANHNIVGHPANLSPFGSNGGPTQTFVPLPGSLAINAGAAVGSGPAGNPVPNVDQRGVPRPINGVPDIGAVEVFSGYTQTVNSTADGPVNAYNCAVGNPSTCRLRDAISVVNGSLGGGTTITFDAVVFPANTAKTITLDQTAGTLTLSVNQTIDGTGHAVVVDGGCTGCDPGGTPSGGVPVFQINGVTASFTALTIQHAGSQGLSTGGGIINIGGALTLTNLILRDNVAGFGGGLFSIRGTVNGTNVTVADNTTQLGGGGIFSESTLTLTNSTVVGNSSAGGNGGGIHSEGTLTLTNTLVAGNTGHSPDVLGVINGTNNLIGDGTGMSGVTDGTSGNLVGHPALTGPLGNYGGPTQTVPLLPSSLAIDAGDDATCAAAPVSGKDQRGITRPQGAHCDIGAFESQGFSLTRTGGDNQSVNATLPFPDPLSVSVTANNPLEPVNGGTVTFTVVPNAGASAPFGALTGCTVSGGTTAVCTIASGAATSPALTANLTPGPFTVPATVPGAPTQTFTLTITAPTIAVSPGTLPGGVKNIVYPAGTTLTATGGTASYTFAVTGGTIPPGLHLAANGALTGTPTATGSFTFTVTATDTNGFTRMQQYTIVVTPAALVSIAVTPNPVTLKVGQQQTFTATATYADSSTADVSGAVTWTSDATSIVTVDATGKATAQTGGTAHLTATQGAITSTQATITVTAPTGIGITVNPAANGRSSGATSGSGTTPNPAPSPAPPSGGTTGGGAPAPVPVGR